MSPPGVLLLVVLHVCCVGLTKQTAAAKCTFPPPKLCKGLLRTPSLRLSLDVSPDAFAGFADACISNPSSHIFQTSFLAINLAVNCASKSATDSFHALFDVGLPGPFSQRTFLNLRRQLFKHEQSAVQTLKIQQRLEIQHGTQDESNLNCEALRKCTEFAPCNEFWPKSTASKTPGLTSDHFLSCNKVWKIQNLHIQDYNQTYKMHRNCST